MKTTPKNLGNFFVRVGAGFLAFWLLSMGAFTRVTALRSKSNELEKFTNNFLTMENQFQEVDGPEIANLYAPIEMFSQNIAPTFYVGVYDPNGKLVASTGNYMKLSSGCIDLSRWLTEEQQETLVELNRESSISRRKREDFYTLEVSGWTQDGMIIPRKISYYRAHYTDGSGYLRLKRDDKENVLYDKEPDIPVDENSWITTGEELGRNDALFTLVGFPANGTVEEYRKARDSAVLNGMKEWAQKITDNPSMDRERGAEWSIFRVEWEYDGIVSANLPDAEQRTYVCIWCYRPLKTAVKSLLPLYAGTAVLMLALTVILSCALLRVWRRQERIEQVRRETTAALAHELKTPLSVLSAAAAARHDSSKEP